MIAPANEIGLDLDLEKHSELSKLKENKAELKVHLKSIKKIDLEHYSSSNFDGDQFESLCQLVKSVPHLQVNDLD